MGNKYSQTKEALESFTSPLFEHMKAVTLNDPGHIFTKEELIVTSGVSDRAIRKEIEKIANYYPILATSDKKGYRLGLFSEEMDASELTQLHEDYIHQLNELQSRVNSLYARMKPLIAAKVEAKKLVFKKTGVTLSDFQKVM